MPTVHLAQTTFISQLDFWVAYLLIWLISCSPSLCVVDATMYHHILLQWSTHCPSSWEPSQQTFLSCQPFRGYPHSFKGIVTAIKRPPFNDWSTLENIVLDISDQMETILKLTGLKLIYWVAIWRAKAVIGLHHDSTPLSAHSCLLPLLSTGVDSKESETSYMLNSTSVLLPPACDSSWITNSPNHPGTSKCDSPLQRTCSLLPLSSEALQWPRRPHRVCSTSTLTSSPPTHPLITQLQPHQPLQAHQAPSHHETFICCLFPLPGTLSSWPEVDNFL